MRRRWAAETAGTTGPIGRRWWEPTSVEKSELLSALLAEQGIPHTWLNAKPENVERRLRSSPKAGPSDGRHDRHQTWLDAPPTSSSVATAIYNGPASTAPRCCCPSWCVRKEGATVPPFPTAARLRRWLRQQGPSGLAMAPS